MKLVKCIIKVNSAEDYKRVVDGLLGIYMSHTAVFDAPVSFTVTCHCNSIQAETNLDHVLEDLKLQAVKVPLVIEERVPVRLPELQGPPAPTDILGKVFLISPSLIGRAA